MTDTTARLLRGFLEPCLLALLEGGADYGLSLARRLSAAGLQEIPLSSLYPPPGAPSSPAAVRSGAPSAPPSPPSWRARR